MTDLADIEVMKALGYDIQDVRTVDTSKAVERHGVDPDNILGSALSNAFHNADQSIANTTVESCYTKKDSSDWFRVGKFHPTTNTDSALKLVPSGFVSDVNQCPNRLWRCYLSTLDDDKGCRCVIDGPKEKTPALAICKALMELEG